MCIVTYLPNHNGFYFTSNRDEVNTRQTDYPKAYNHQQYEIIYPKDLEKGGSWFAIDTAHKKMACLLNATGKQPNQENRISRGKLPINFLIEEMSLLKEKTLKRVAPFTLIGIQYTTKVIIEEYHWDGESIKLSYIDEKKPYLWCSNTLYSEDDKNRLTREFKNNLKKIESFRDVVDFHNKMAQPLCNNVFLKKDKDLQTLSITSLKATNKKEIISYSDLLENSIRVLITVNQ
ncbi:MAG: NRDE family protein [Flavobacteriaceae bacterium]